MDPLFKLGQPETSKTLPPAIISRIRNRMQYIAEGVERVERASGIKYPPFYVDPVLYVAYGGIDPGAMGIFYARTIPIEFADRVQICVQLSAPLVLYGSKSTIHAVLAHEFLHYINTLKRIMTFDLYSDTPTSSIFESQYADKGSLYDPKHLFSDKWLISIMSRKIPDRLQDAVLDKKTLTYWIKKKLPTISQSIDSNVIRISTTLMAKMQIDPKVKQKILGIEKARRSVP